MNEGSERGIMVKDNRALFLWLFLLIWEEEICGFSRKKFLPDFLFSIFSSFCQTVENTVFYPIFLPMFSILSRFTPTKRSVNFLNYKKAVR